MPDLKPSELFGIAPLLALIVFLGVYPKPVLDRIEPSVDLLVDHVETNVTDFVEDEPEEISPAGVDDLVHSAEEAHEGEGGGEE